ncbi:ABC transporter permease [Candidatus Acetothermia bacterium]|nr:MAG: ABC transporter permease [Candidatus Acetothermia bacterium]RLE68687.1 MAG: ABC transporter permease [Thermoprotei archaeon]
MSRGKMLRHFLRDPSAVVGAAILSVFVIGAVFAPLIAPQNPYDLEALSLADSLKPPIWMEGGEAPFLLGTDEQGRDVLSTILYGCRTSLTVAFGVVLVAGTFGMLMGLLAGFYGKLIDALVMRSADVFYSFSTTLMAILVLGLLKQKGVLVLILAISLTDWVRYARTLRGSVLAIKEEDYIDAARAVGVPTPRIIFHHVLPNAVPPLLVVAAVDFGVVIMLEATLSFLGVGLPVTEPSLGMMISLGRKYVYAGKWWLIVFPGVALTAIVVGINLIADWLREEINPRIQKAVKGR